MSTTLTETSEGQHSKLKKVSSISDILLELETLQETTSNTYQGDVDEDPTPCFEFRSYVYPAFIGHKNRVLNKR